MESFRKWFSFSKGERVAIVTLLAAILILVLACMFRPSRKSLDEVALHNLDSLLALRQASIEELQRQQANRPTETVELHPFPFNPNTISEEELRQIGLADRQIRNVLNYRTSGGKFYSKKDFGKLYTISDEDFAQLEPFIVLPEVSRPASHQPRNRNNNTPPAEETTPGGKKEIPIVDLNTADSTLLVELPQIGPYMASRILDFREKLGGFVDMEQLYDVKGMDSTRFATIQPFLVVGEITTQKIDVNRADFRTLVRHPYLSYEQVKCIFNQREQRGMIRDWSQLEALIGEAGEVNPLLERYVKF